MSHLLFGDLGKLSEAAREREPEPKVDATIEVLRPYSGRDVFKSDSSQRYEEPLRTTVGPLTYNTVNRGVQASTCDASSTFNSKTLTGGGVAANLTTANVDFVTDHPRKHANTRASAPFSHGQKWPNAQPSLPKPVDLGSEHLSDRHLRPEASINANTFVSERRLAHAFLSEQPRLAPLPRREPGQFQQEEGFVLRSLQVFEPKRETSTFKKPVLNKSASGPSGSFGSGRFLSKTAEAAREPYGGGDWIVPRLPPKRRRNLKKIPAHILKDPLSGPSLSASSSAANLVPGDAFGPIGLTVARPIGLGARGHLTGSFGGFGACVSERSMLPVSSCSSLDRPTF